MAPRRRLSAGRGAKPGSRRGDPGCVRISLASAGADGWIDLFDGGATHGLRAYGGGEFPSDHWQIVDGTLRTIPGSGSTS